jgi:hypothetical protein
MHTTELLSKLQLNGSPCTHGNIDGTADIKMVAFGSTPTKAHRRADGVSAREYQKLASLIKNMIASILNQARHLGSTRAVVQDLAQDIARLKALLSSPSPALRCVLQYDSPQKRYLNTYLQEAFRESPNYATAYQFVLDEGDVHPIKANRAFLLEGYESKSLTR